jgi:serine/threonine protein kinase
LRPNKPGNLATGTSQSLTLSGMESGGESPRWQGQRSSFPWEQEALDYIKGQMPETEPYRARQTFTFTARSGHVREVDLLIATPGGLFLVEIKSHPGIATNNGSTWMFRDAGIQRTIENPLHFTDQKCKELKEQLQRAAGQSARVPRIEPVVFLSATNLVCRFDDFQKQRVYGRDDRSGTTHLGGIWGDFLNQPPASERNRVTPTFSRQLPRLLEAIGIARVHRAGKVGPYELEPKSFDSGPTWADYLASNPSLPSDHARRVRIYLSERTASDEERRSVQRAAYREYMALQGISHDGIVRAEQYSDELLAGPAVVFRHGKNWQRLDQFMAAVSSDDSLPLETRLDMIRQLGEALEHAHRSRLHHRALAPRSVYVEMDGRYPRLRIADWQVAVRPHGTTTGTSRAASAVSPATTGLGRHIELSAGPYLAPEFAKDDAVPALMDVFGLGAVSYLILTGAPPAASRAELAGKLSSEHALVPSAVADSVSPAMDDLISGATQVSAADRTESVRQFLRQLDAIEDELTTPDAAADIDPLTAGRGDEINGWTVDRVLGKGSTSRAFLVRKDGARRAYKVAVSESAARRLEAEAAQLDQLLDSHVARLLDPPFLAGPKGKQRTVIGVEYIEGDTLAEEISRQGPLAIHELERLGEDLFQALKFLDRRQVWHRDIKPDNLILRELDRKGRELVLIDFSLAGIPDTDINAGTRAYLDPFLGEASKGRRQRYDQAAELYAVAVTLHEMASGELPTWGDDMADPAFLDPGEEVQLSADLFDPVARDNMEAFFRVALARNVSDRFSSLQEMTRAWTDVFRDLETVPPLTTAATEDGDEQASISGDERAGTARQPEQDRAARARTASAKRTEASRAATPATPLSAAGLSPYALSAALQKLRVSTAGELAAIPAAKITRLRGIGSVPRYELVRLARDWRQRFTPDVQWTSGAEHGPVAEVISPEPAAAPVEEDLAHLSVDAVVRLLVPGSQELARVVGLAAGTGGVASPWAGQREIARVTGLAETDVAGYLDRLRNRWAKSVPALLAVRNDLVQILEEHGRVLGWRQLAAGLLARRGSKLADSAERIRLAAICVRAAVETEERLNSARLSSRRLPGRDGERVILALTGAGEEVPAARADELFAFAGMLGEEADALAGRDPLPSVAEIKQVLREVPTADNTTRLSDTDLVLLAAAASQKTAATPRLELYPRDLAPLRAVKISQAGSIAEGAFESELVRRVLARFPDLYEASRPKAADMPDLLGRLGYDVTRGSDSKLWVRSSTQLTSSRGARVAAASEPKSVLVEAIARAYRRLAEARTRGGFIALKVPLADAARIADHVAGMDGVTGVNVTATFTRLLREVVAEQGRPRWETVLAADSPDASPAARNGLAQLLSKTWERLEAHVRAAGASGIVALHDATPLARYAGGPELLAKLTVAARDACEAPFGMWLVCPMEDPQGSPLLDRKTVSVIPGDAEQLYVPEGFGSSGKGLLAG